MASTVEGPGAACDWTGAAVVVVGGTRGIGARAARQMAEAGAEVAVVGRRPPARPSTGDADGDRAPIRWFTCDIASPDDVVAAFDRIESSMGRFRHCLNAAATTASRLSRTGAYPVEEFDRVMGVNLRGVWMCMRQELERLRGWGEGGAVVNVGSVAGLGGAPHDSIYSASKAALVALSKAAAIEYAPAGVRVNALVPGATETRMLRRALARAATCDVPSDRVREGVMRTIPVGRAADPEEIAEVATWLLSARASYVTGEALVADGGMSAAYR